MRIVERVLIRLNDAKVGQQRPQIAPIPDWDAPTDDLGLAEFGKLTRRLPGVLAENPVKGRLRVEARFERDAQQR